MINKLINLIREISHYRQVTISLIEAFNLYKTYEKNNKKVYTIKVKQLGNKPVKVRSNTSDTMVLLDVFTSGFHLPNVFLQNQKPVIFDLGCNVGYTTLDFLYHYPKAKIFAVEMSDDNVLASINNLPENSNVKFINAAIWKNDGEIEYLVGLNEQSNSIGLVENANRQQIKKRVQTLTIDTLLKQNNLDFVDYIKMDIEGAEIDVLFDSECKWLEKTGAIKIEVHKDEYIIKTVDLLNKRGFKAYRDEKHPFCVYAIKTH